MLQITQLCLWVLQFERDKVTNIKSGRSEISRFLPGWGGNINNGFAWLGNAAVLHSLENGWLDLHLANCAQGPLHGQLTLSHLWLLWLILLRYVRYYSLVFFLWSFEIREKIFMCHLLLPPTAMNIVIYFLI